jgi:type I restriction enzyme S subunit
MSKWDSVTLGEVAKISREIVDASEIKAGTFYVGLENIESGGRFTNVRPVASGELASSKFAFTPKHLLFGKLRPYLAKIARPDFDGICSTDIVPVLPTCKVDRDYLAHFLLTPEMVTLASSRATGANLPRLSPNTLTQFEIPLPPLTEQRRIATLLDRAKALRAKRSAALAQVDELTAATFIEMFGNPATNPSKWPTQPLSSFIRNDDNINYGVVQPGDDVADGIPLVRVGDLVDGGVSHTSLKRISPAVEAAYKRSRLRGDEILVSCVGSIGIVAVADESVAGFNIARAVARVPLADTRDRAFVAAYLSTSFVQQYFTNELRTVSQPTLNIKQLSETAVIFPPAKLRYEFGRRVAAVEKLKGAQRASLAELDALFASLQHRAFRGEL